jgi:alpha-beta hydrolase superfamily lysophospholipase
MTERVVSFGAADGVGILALPDKEVALGGPAFLMWNVGLHHHVGPFRIYVDLARKLAAAGFVAFRFDGSGLGDSGVRREAVSDTQREELDILEAMDAVTRRTGISSFVLIGFCSSVDAAHRASVKDRRVVGVIHIEGYAFETRGNRRRRYRRWFSRRRWERRAWMTFPWLFPQLGGPINLKAEAVFKRDYPDWPQFTRELAELTQRGVDLLFVYAGGDTPIDHERQFWEMFGSRALERSKVAVVHYAEADHTFFDVRIRDAVMARILAFARALPRQPMAAESARSREA